MGKSERKNQTPNDININKEDEETTTTTKTATHQMSERAQAKRAMKNT